MTTKKLLKGLIGIVIIAMILAIYWISTFELLPVDETLLSKFKDRSNQVTYEIYLMSGNATTNDAIQIRRVDSTKSTVISSIDGYNEIQSVTVLNDSIVQLVLRDAMLPPHTSDTFNVNLRIVKPTVR